MDGDSNHMSTGPVHHLGLTAWQVAQLAEDVPKDEVLLRSIGGSASAKYVKKEYLQSEMNRIFGIASWSRETVEFLKVSEQHIKMTRNKAVVDGVQICWTARCRVTIRLPGPGLGSEITIIREGVGTCASQAQSDEEKGGIADASEIAIKGAETDAFKRAVAGLGRRLGLDIEDQEAEPRDVPDSHARLAAAKPSTVPTGRPGSNGAAKTAAKATTPVTASTPARGAQVAGAAPTTAQAPAEDLSASIRGTAWDSEDPFGLKAEADAKKAAAKRKYAELDRDQWRQTFGRLNEIIKPVTEDPAPLFTVQSRMDEIRLAQEDDANQQWKDWFDVLVARLHAKLPALHDAEAQDQLSAWCKATIFNPEKLDRGD